jgi:peptidoglycan lytic transglycosylase
LALALSTADLSAAAHPRHSDAHAHAQVGVASFYGVHGAGKVTASGERFSPRKLTAASPTLPIGAKAKVTNEKTGKTVAVRVNDRGPFMKHRILDVSPAAAHALGMKKDGLALVKVKPLSLPADQR